MSGTTTAEDEAISQVLSNLEISDNSVYHVNDEQDDMLHDFKQEFIEFLSRNPQIVTNSTFIPNKSKTLVVLSPLSTKHSFGRHWVTKTYLSTIVERPQRLLASSMGIAAAISMYPAHYTLMSSTKRSPLTSPHVLKIHGKNWPGDIEKICVESEEKLKKGEIEVPDGWNSGDIYLTKTSLDALTGVIGAVETAIDSIFKDDDETPRRAFVAIRPPGHHSHPCVPSGFCLINNAHIAIEYAAMTQGVTHAVILDFDLHHGDGSQDICWQKAGFEPDFGEISAGYEEGDDDPDEHTKKDANTPKGGYFSLHDINSFPTELGYAIPTNIKNASTCIMAHDLNIWNVHLQPYTTEEDFYKLYQTKYSILLQKADEYLTNARREHEDLIRQNGKMKSPRDQIPPFKAFVVISAGFDASEYEVQTMQRHGVHVPTSFYSKFTSDAVKLANKQCNGTVLSLLEGGYSDGALTSGVFSHLVGFQRQSWEAGWGHSDVIKELIKGCRPNWKPLKNPSNEVKNWANQVCKLGRVMVPDSIIRPMESKAQNHGVTPANYHIARMTRSHASKLPAKKMVTDEGDMSLDDIEFSAGAHDNSHDVDVKADLLTEELSSAIKKGE